MEKAQSDGHTEHPSQWPNTLVNSISMTGSLMTTRLINEGGAATTQEESTSSNMENSGLELTDQMLEEAQYTTMDSLGPECKYI